MAGQWTSQKYTYMFREMRAGLNRAHAVNNQLPTKYKKGKYTLVLSHLEYKCGSRISSTNFHTRLCACESIYIHFGLSY
jgi:hypothetical protein